ncbi:HDOD domain-containing protein [Alteromonadaceae bacterium BrNp21-10]|nr:HDOD domain-containing protein [Alteromonadaceae bacterium BrNp21-10]
MALFAARQPILDIDKNLFAYELLFRESLENVFPKGFNDNVATTKIIEGLQFNLGLDTLTKNKLAFINFTYDTLMNKYPLLLPNDQVVIEILETVKPGKKVLAVVQELKEKGYIIALDDYIHEDVWKHFYPYIDIIKVDWPVTTLETIKEIINAIRLYPHIRLLAEKIESYDEFKLALDLGFTYFQGYFFSKPEVIESPTISPSQFALTQLMTELSKTDPDTDAVSKVFENDVNLSFKLLRYAQSAIFKRRADISTIKQALVVLGQQELRRFVSLLFAAQFSDTKPLVLVSMSQIRARFCEQLAELSGQQTRGETAFLVGLLSLLDALLDSTLESLLEKLPLSDDVKHILCDKQGVLGEYLQLVQALEKGDWPAVKTCSANIGLSEEDVNEQYQLALAWAAERENLT